MANLRRALQVERKKLEEMCSEGVDGMTREALEKVMRVGDADVDVGEGLDANISDTAAGLGGAEADSSNHESDPSSAASTTASSKLLRLQAVASAYERNNASLREETKAYAKRSSELEARYRKVIALCTGVKVEEIDGLMAGLVRAVEAEGGEVELGRVREFLRKVAGEDDEGR